MKKFLKSLLKLFYVLNIYVILLSAYLVLKWIIARKEHNGLVLMGLVGMIHRQAILTLIISVLIFIILSVIFIKYKKKQIIKKHKLYNCFSGNY